MKRLILSLVLCLCFVSTNAKKKIDLAKYLGDKAGHFEKDMDKLLENWNIPFRSWKLKVYPRKKKQSSGGGDNGAEGGCSCGEGDGEATEPPCPCANGGGNNANAGGNSAGGPVNQQPGQQGPAQPNAEAPVDPSKGYRPGSPQDPAYNRCQFTPQVCMCGAGAGASPTTAALAGGAATPAAAATPTTAAPAGGDAAATPAPAAADAAAAAETTPPAGMWRRNLQYYPQQYNGYQQPPQAFYQPPMQQQYQPYEYPQAPVGGDEMQGFHEHLDKAADFMNKASEKLKAYADGVNKGGDDNEDAGNESGGCSCDKAKSSDNPCGPCGGQQQQGPMQQAQPQQPAQQQPAQQPVPGQPQGNNKPMGASQLQPAQPPPVDPACEKKKNVYCERICKAFDEVAGAGPNAGGAAAGAAPAAPAAAPAGADAAAPAGAEAAAPADPAAAPEGVGLKSY